MSYSQLLSQVPIFEHLSSLLQARRYPKGEVIFHQGDVGTALFIIRKGQIAIRLSSPDGKEATLALLERGDFSVCTFLCSGAVEGFTRQV